MTPKDIRKAFIDADLTAAELARRLGVTPAAVKHVIHGRRRSPAIRRAIADALGMYYSRVWGEEDPGPPPAPGVPKGTPVTDSTRGAK